MWNNNFRRVDETLSPTRTNTVLHSPTFSDIMRYTVDIQRSTVRYDIELYTSYAQVIHTEYHIRDILRDNKIVLFDNVLHIHYG